MVDEIVRDVGSAPIEMTSKSSKFTPEWPQT